MSIDDENISAAREFFSVCKETNNLEDIMNSDTPLKVGLDLETEEILIGVHDKVFFMNQELAEATVYALWLACRTLDAKREARNN